MTRAVAFDPSDRLPWLSEPAPAAPPRKRFSFVIVALAGAAGIAGAAGWSAIEQAFEPQPPASQVIAERTVKLQPPAAAEPKPAPSPVVEAEALRLPAEPPPRAIAPAPPPGARKERAAVKPERAPKRLQRAPAPPRAAPARAPARSATYDPGAWNSGVAGRIIQLGAFRTAAQAEGQWTRVYYRYPLLRPLPPRVVRTNIRGRTYYRLQLGTFSHAHSEMLCQRLRAIGEGCIVLGLSRKPRR